MPRKLRSLRGWVLPALLIGAWQYASTQGAAQAYAFVPLSTLGQALSELLASGELLTNTLASLQRTCLGLGFGALFGLMVGAAMGLSGTARRLLGPLFHMLRQVPILGLVPLIALWFGSGETAKLLIVSLAAFYPMTLNVQEGFSHVDRRYREVGRSLEFSRLQMFFEVLLPSASPAIVNGVLHALAFAWVSSVGCELFLSTGAGLGNLMMNAEVGARMEVVVICIVCIGLLGYGMNLLFARLGHHVLRWRDLN